MLEYNPVIYVFLNKSLGMSVGKAAAQTAHAVAMSLIELNSDVYKAKWIASPHRTVIVLAARDQQHMDNIRAYLQERDIPLSYIIDEGMNEIDPHTPTAMATRILNKDKDEVVAAMSTFELYRDDIQVQLRINR